MWDYSIRVASNPHPDRVRPNWRNEMKYAFAVMDENFGDSRVSPQSCHHTASAAIKAAQCLNASDHNAHYRAVQWADERWAREFPSHPRGVLHGQ